MVGANLGKQNEMTVHKRPNPKAVKALQIKAVLKLE